MMEFAQRLMERIQGLVEEVDTLGKKNEFCNGSKGTKDFIGDCTCSNDWQQFLEVPMILSGGLLEGGDTVWPVSSPYPWLEE